MQGHTYSYRCALKTFLIYVLEPISAVVMIVNAPNPVPRLGVDDLWTQWADWSACSVSCGPGLRNRTRACVSRLCSGFDMQYEPCKGLREDCDNQTGVEVQGSAVVVWAMWSEWSPCDVRCGAGSRARQRSCLTPNLALCDGQTISEERQFCVKQACRSGERYVINELHNYIAMFMRPKVHSPLLRHLNSYTD